MVHNISLNFSFEIDNDNIDISKKIGGIFFIKTKIGKYAIGCVLGAVGTARKIENRYEVYNPHREYFKNVIVEEKTAVTKDDLLKLAHEIADEMGKVDIVPVILDR